MKIKKVFIVSIILLLINYPIVMAKEIDTYKIELNSLNSTLKEGNIIEMTLKVKDINIQSGEKGIGAYEGKIDYNKKVFELVEIQGNENWDSPIENEGRFTSVKSDGICINEEQVLATIILKVKDDIKSGNEIIEIKDFKVSNGEISIATDDANLKLKIEGGSKFNILFIMAISLLIIVIFIICYKKINKKKR